MYIDSQVCLTDIKDGSSNTLLVGERPPSADEFLGWWDAGVGQAEGGSCDIVLSVRERNISGYRPGCPVGPYPSGPGRLNNQCDAFHFWSLHSGGANFLFADGAVHFVPYSADPIMPALTSREGGECVDLSF